jgi:hypothetical protein
VSISAPCIGFRKGTPRALWAPPVAAGRFAFLEMSDRRATRSRAKAKPEPRTATLDPHREPSPRLLAAWAPVERELRQAVDESTYRIWLADVHPHSLIDGTWTLACPRLQTVGWVADRLGRVIRDCAGCPVMFVACEAVA